MWKKLSEKGFKNLVFYKGCLLPWEGKPQFFAFNKHAACLLELVNNDSHYKYIVAAMQLYFTYILTYSTTYNFHNNAC